MFDITCENEDMSREIQPDGQKINRLREERGWQAQDLADKAGCSLRTITNLEAGKRCFKCTLARVASALGVEYRELLTGAEPPPLPPSREVRITVQVTFSTPDGESDETDGLTEWVKKVCYAIQGLRPEPPEDIEVQNVEKGSVVVTVEMNASDLALLMRYLAVNPMSDLDIQAVKVPEGVMLPAFDGRGSPIPPRPKADDGTKRIRWHQD